MRYILVQKNIIKKAYEFKDHWDNFNDLMNHLDKIPTHSFTALYGTSSYSSKRKNVKKEFDWCGVLKSSAEHNLIIDLKNKKLDNHYIKIAYRFKNVIRDIRLDELLK